MASSLNRVTIIGNCGQDPEIRVTQAGKKVASLRVATSDSWTDKATGEKKESVDWHSCVVWNEHLIPVIEKYVKKGSRILIEGQLKTRKWQDQSGQDRYSTEVVIQGFNGQIILLGDRGKSDGDSAPAPAPAKAAAPPSKPTAAPARSSINDDIPFLYNSL